MTCIYKVVSSNLCMITNGNEVNSQVGNISYGSLVLKFGETVYLTILLLPLYSLLLKALIHWLSLHLQKPYNIEWVWLEENCSLTPCT